MVVLIPKHFPEAQKAGANVFVAATAIFGHPLGIVEGINDLHMVMGLNKNRDMKVAISD